MDSVQRIVLATGNAGKLKEIRALLAPLAFDVVPQGELGISDAAETGLTFIENALIKARHAAQHSGLPALADDSGLAVDALGGAPGIYSARYAGPQAHDTDNNQKLLRELADTPDAQRGARYHCVLVYLRHAADPTPLICHGQWQGRILNEPQGDGGFGYDPLFFVPIENCSAAELSAARKNALSHRGQALRLLIQHLQKSTPPKHR